MKVGFIGLGNMGEPMATSVLKAGHQLTVLDIRREVAQSLLEKGATWADTPRAVAQASEVVLTSLPGPSEVEAVALGDEGIIHGIAPDAVYIDLSTSAPSLLKRMHQRFKEKGSHVMDSPILGGRTGAWDRKVMMLPSGDEAIFQRCKPILDAIGEDVRYCGSLGNGTACKLVHNCIGYSTLMCFIECLTLGVKAGVEPRLLWEVLRDADVGKGTTLKSTLPRTVFQGKFEPGFALKGAHKDVSLATGLGRELGVPMMMSDMTLHQLLEAANRGWEEKDSRIVALLQEERAGVQVRIPGPFGS